MKKILLVVSSVALVLVLVLWIAPRFFTPQNEFVPPAGLVPPTLTPEQQQILNDLLNTPPPNVHNNALTDSQLDQLNRARTGGASKPLSDEEKKILTRLRSAK